MVLCIPRQWVIHDTRGSSRVGIKVAGRLSHLTLQKSIAKCRSVHAKFSKWEDKLLAGMCSGNTNVSLAVCGGCRQQNSRQLITKWRLTLWHLICLFSHSFLFSLRRLSGLRVIWLALSASSRRTSLACGSSSCFSTPARKPGRMTHQPSPSCYALCLPFSPVAGSRDALQLIRSLIRFYYCIRGFTICKMPLELTVVGCKSLAPTATNWISARLQVWLNKPGKKLMPEQPEGRRDGFSLDCTPAMPDGSYCSLAHSYMS